MRTMHRAKTSYDQIQRSKSGERDRKIMQLGDVLSKQRQTIKQLLGKDADKGMEGDRSRVKGHTYSQLTQPSVKHEKTMKESEQYYQKLSADIIEQGNRALKTNRIYTDNIRSPSPQPLRRQQHTHQLYKSQLQVHRLKQQEQQYISRKDDKNQTFEKEIQYLKSSGYQHYLENITKEKSSYRQDRNHQVYIGSYRGVRNQVYSGRVSNRSPRRVFEHRTTYDYQKSKITPLAAKLNVQNDDKIIEDQVEQTINLDLNILKRQLQILTSSPVPSPKQKTMNHTPTVSQINAPQQLHTPEPPPPPRPSLSQNMKIQSNTINVLMELTKSDEKKKNNRYVMTQEINQFFSGEKNKQQDHDYAERRQKKKKLKDIIDYKINDRSQPLKSKNQNTQFSSTVYPKKQTKKKKKQSIPLNYDFTLNNKYESQQTSQQFSEQVSADHKFTIDFKLQKPAFCRIGKSKQKQNAGKPILTKKKKNYKDIENIDLKMYLKPQPTKHSKPTARNIFPQTPLTLHISQSTSTMARQTQPQSLPKTPSRSQTKLSVITPSRMTKK